MNFEAYFYQKQNQKKFGVLVCAVKIVKFTTKVKFTTDLILLIN